MSNRKYNLEEIEEQLSKAKIEKESQSQKEDSSVKENPKKKSLISRLFTTLIQVTILPLIILFIFTFILGIAKVKQESMLPNFAEGDIILYNRLETNFKVGDVVIIHLDYQQNNLMKRIIAIPGDTIDITSDHKILVNGVELRESWTTLGENIRRDVSFPLTLKENEYFVIGDNREVSKDSRSSEIGNILYEDIIGVIFYKFKMSK